MSASPRGSILPKTGNVLPAPGGPGDAAARYGTAVARALRHDLAATPGSIKGIMRWTGASERTVKNWLAGTNGPSGEHLIALVARSDEVLDTVLAMAGRGRIVAGLRLLAARDRLAAALAEIDVLVDG